MGFEIATATHFFAVFLPALLLQLINVNPRCEPSRSKEIMGVSCYLNQDIYIEIYRAYELSLKDGDGECVNGESQMCWFTSSFL